MASVEDDGFRDEFLFERLDAREDRGDVVGELRVGGRVSAAPQQLEEAKAGLPPVIWRCVVGDEG